MSVSECPPPVAEPTVLVGSSSAHAEVPGSVCVYSAVRWSAFAKYGAQGIEFVTSIIVARMLAPENYGLLGMAIVVTGFVMVFQNLGFAAAIVQRKQVNDALLSSLFFFSLAFGCILAVGVALASPLVSWTYGDPRVGRIVTVLTLTFVMSSVSMVPSALLTRRLAFNRLAIGEWWASLVRGATAISLAASGWEVWALVAASLVGSAAQTLAVCAFAGWRPQFVFHWREVASVFRFGVNLTGCGFLSYCARNVDSFLIGTFLGPTALGYYTVAYRLMLLPRDAVTDVITRVMFPLLSRLQDDDARLKAAVLRVCDAIAFVTFPMMLGLMVVARPFVETVLGPRWLPAVPLICILAPAGMLASVVSPAGQLYLAKGRADWLFRWMMVTTGTLTVGLLLGLAWGAVGAAVAFGITGLLLAVPTYSIILRCVEGFNVWDVIRVLLPHLASAGTMALLVLAVRAWLENSGVTSAMTLVSTVGAGIVSYTGMVLLLRPPFFRELPKLLFGR